MNCTKATAATEPSAGSSTPTSTPSNSPGFTEDEKLTLGLTVGIGGPTIVVAILAIATRGTIFAALIRALC